MLTRDRDLDLNQNCFKTDIYMTILEIRSNINRFIYIYIYIIRRDIVIKRDWHYKY